MNQVVTQNKSGNGLEVLGMRINSLTEAMQLADFFAKSDLVPKDYKGKAGNIVVAWQKGYEVGLAPQQSLETIAVINGRACIWGDGLIALIKNSPKEEWTNEWIDGEGDDMIAYCETKRKDQPKTIKRGFSVKEAIVAGLWGVNVWKKYPTRMLQMRARGFCFRDAYPDVLNGLQLAEEQMDIANQNYIELERVEPAIIQLGLSLKKENNIATVQGNCFHHAKVLKELGFEYRDKQWVAFYEDLINGEIVSKQIIQPLQVPQSTQKSPAHRLMAYLKENGLTTQEIGDFVKNELGGLSSENIEGIEAVLSDEETLNEKIQMYLSQKDDGEVPDDVF